MGTKARATKHPKSTRTSRKPASATARHKARGAFAALDLSGVRLLVLDVDGVMTDGGVYYREEGTPLLRFSIVDGLGIVLLQRAGVDVAVLSSGSNPILGARVKRLGIKHFRPGVMKKGDALRELLSEIKVAAAHVAYLSDDVNDVAALRAVGFPVAVANARPEVAAVCRAQTVAGGGHGAVREVCDAIIYAHGHDPVSLWDAGGGAS